jgi:hypothetical protein
MEFFGIEPVQSSHFSKQLAASLFGILFPQVKGGTPTKASDQSPDDEHRFRLIHSILQFQGALGLRFIPLNVLFSTGLICPISWVSSNNWHCNSV